MNYDVTKKTAPAMPTLGRGTECIKLLLSQTSKVMHEPLVPMLFPPLGAHVSGAEFQYPDRSWKEMCGLMANLVAQSGDNKGQFSPLVEAICRDFRAHDKAEQDKLDEWVRIKNTKGSNKDKPPRPDVAFWIPPNDVTKAAFLQNAIGLEQLGARTQYYNMPEVEMADQLCGNHRQLSQLLRNVYDRQRAGALRATADGISGNPVLRVNLSFSANPYSVRRFFKNDLHNGAFGRMVFSYKPRSSREGRIPRIGLFDDRFYSQLDDYLVRLDSCKGRFIIRPLNKLIDRMAEDMAQLADLTDDDLLFEMSHRSLVSAWKAGCILWIMNEQTWTKAMGDMVEWLAYRDIWSKFQLFADMLHVDADETSEAQRRGPKNMLDDLTATFNIEQVEALRVSLGKSKEGTNRQLRVWLSRGFITYSNQTGLYTKTEEYLKGKGNSEK